MRRTAMVVQEYAGRALAVGEAFDVEPQDVELLLRLGRIEPEKGDAVPGYAAKPQPVYNTREMRPASGSRTRRTST